VGELFTRRWRKSSRSSNTGSDCVEIADGHSGIFVRDSKLSTESPVLTFTVREWQLFTNAVKAHH
jgi:hypothetical protein